MMEELQAKNKDEPKSFYTTRSYQMYIKEKYDISRNTLLYDDNISLLLYASEWFQVPKSNVFMKIQLHPCLTIKHDHLLNTYQNQYRRNLAFVAFGTGLVYNLFGNKKTKARRALNFIVSIVIGTTGALLFNQLYYKKKYEQQLAEDPSLKQYLELDLDRNKIREDLKNYGIVLKN